MGHRLRALLLGAVAALGAAAVSPRMDALADAHLSAHMLEHVVIGDLCPALTVVALAPWVRRRRLPGPVVSFGLWAAALAAWHLPAAYDFAEAHVAVHVAEHASFVVAGLLAWSQLVRLPPAQGTGFAVAMLAGGMLLSTALLAPYRPIYDAYPSFRDQQLAALVMTLEQLLTLGTFLTVRLRAYLRAPEPIGVHGHPFLS